MYNLFQTNKYTKLKIFILATNGRSGSDFFHSLLDNHPQIATLPGHLNLKKLKKIHRKNNIRYLISFFIKNHSFFFNSKKNTAENHHRLGIRKNDFFKINIMKFKKDFFHLNKLNNNFEIILKNIHLAYFKQSQNDNLKNIKIIFIHVHHLENLINFNIYKNEIFYSYRHPISILNSGINAFLKKNGNLFTVKTLNFYLKRLIEEPFNLKISKKIYLIRLENLHTRPFSTLKKVCKIMNIKFSKTLTEPTFLGKLWWGDQFSQNLKLGFNNNFKILINTDNFYKKDFYLIQKMLEDPLKKLNYNKIHFKKKNFLYLFFPLKIETIFFIEICKKLKLKEIISFIVNYFFRLFLFYLNYKNTKMKKNIVII